MVSSSIGSKRSLVGCSAEQELKAQIMSMSARCSTWSPGLDFGVSMLTPAFGSTPIHENVERRADPIGRDAKVRERATQVLEATRVLPPMVVRDLEHPLTAGREQAVVASDEISADGEYLAALVGVRNVAVRRRSKRESSRARFTWMWRLSKRMTPRAAVPARVPRRPRAPAIRSSTRGLARLESAIGLAERHLLQAEAFGWVRGAISPSCGE